MSCCFALFPLCRPDSQSPLAARNLSFEDSGDEENEQPEPAGPKTTGLEDEDEEIGSAVAVALPVKASGESAATHGQRPRSTRKIRRPTILDPSVMK